MKKYLAVVLLALAPAALLRADPVVYKAHFDPEAGPNQYTVTFPPELGSTQVFMPISGGSFELEADAAAGTARLLSWSQDIDPIVLFGFGTGPIAVSMDLEAGSEGTFDAASRHFSVTATFLITFDDSELRNYGFISPVALVGTEEGYVYGVGSIGSISMYLEGQGSYAGGTFSYTCQTTARFEYDLEEDEAQPGDVNHDRDLDLTDPILILGTLFLGSSMQCPEAAEVNHDQVVNMSDAVYLLNYLYIGGPPTPAEPVSCPADL
jgi:opacity protein-like surface antigen